MDELPESWRRTLREERAAAKKVIPRPPIQPPFALWPWAVLAAGAPLAALSAAFIFSRVLGCEFPSWPGALMFAPLLMLVNGGLTARAISSSKNYFRFALVGALKGLLSVALFLIPNASELALIFLTVYCGLRLIGRIGFGGIVFSGILAFTGCLLLPAFAYFFKSSGLSILPLAQESNIGLALAMAAAYPLAHALCTGALPAQPTFMGRIDAASSGISSALLGLFSGVVLYRTTRLVIEIIAWWKHIDMSPLLETAAVCSGLVAGNVVCVWTLFRTAYSERDAVKEIVAKPVDVDLFGLKTPNRKFEKPAHAPVGVEQDETFDDAT